MASGNGLKRKVPKFNDPRKSDLMLCVRFEDIYGFFLFSELHDEKSLRNTSLIYDKSSNVKFDREYKNKLATKNKLIGVVGDKIVQKVPFVKLFQFDVFQQPAIIPSKVKRRGSFKNSYSSIFDYLNGSGLPVKGPSGNISRTNFLNDSNIKKINSSASQYDTYVLRVLQDGGFIIPNDVENFLSFIGMNPKKEYNELSIKFTDVPRLCDQQFLNYMMKQEGRKQFTGGFLCYTVIPYQKNQTGLIPNVAINDSSHITSINYKEYTNNNFVFDRKLCNPKDFQINDKVIGFIRGGIYVLNTDDTIIKLEQGEKRYFDSVSGGKRGFMENFRKNFRYPRTVLNIIVMRSSFNIADFDTRTSRQSSIHYAEGFYNTLSMSKSGMQNISIFGIGARPDSILKFRDILCKEFFEFIRNQFLRNLIKKSATDRSAKTFYDYIRKIERRCYLESEEYARKRGPRNSFSFLEGLFGDNRRVTEKSSFVYVITNLMGIKDPNMAVIQFFGLPAIIHGHTTENQYPNLRNISYFVRCSLAESCEDIIPISGAENYSFPFMVSGGSGFIGGTMYSLYFNTKFAMFTNQAT